MFRRHAPLVLVALAAAGATLATAAVDSRVLDSLAGNLWGLVLLLTIFDVTPRDAAEKRPPPDG